MFVKESKVRAAIVDRSGGKIKRVAREVYSDIDLLIDKEIDRICAQSRSQKTATHAYSSEQLAAMGLGPRRLRKS